jgi:hypothetical protein
MNIADMHIAFQIGVDKVASLNYPGFESEEVDFILNQAQDEFVKTRYGGNNLYRKGFEENQKRTDDIRSIVKRASIAPQPVDPFNKPFGLYYLIPNSPNINDVYWFSVHEEVTALVTDCNGFQIKQRIPVKPITHDTYSRMIMDPFNKPSETELLRLEVENKIEIITAPNVQVLALLITYVRRPQRVDVTIPTDCELPEHSHQEVVNTACGIALEGIESRRNQTQKQEQTQQE